MQLFTRVERELMFLVGKSTRVLMMLYQLLEGKEIKKLEYLNHFNIDERTFERDIKTIRDLFDNHLEEHERKELNYCRAEDIYKLDFPSELKFRGNEALALVKVLLESRAFCEKEMHDVIDTILKQVEPEEKNKVNRLIQNEVYHFVPLKHNKELFNILWDLSQAIDTCRNVSLSYYKANGEYVQRLVSPVGIIFSDYYFYVMCYFPNKPLFQPISYRLDRIESYEVLKERFKRPYSERFQEGEFRKKIHSMYQGELVKFSFEFTGHSIEAVIDQFPCCKVIEQGEGKYLVEAEAYEQGLVMWILSQGDWIKVLSPSSLVEKIKTKVENIAKLY